MRTSELRVAWREYECAAHYMITIDFGPDRIRVAPPTAEAWRALAQVFEVHGYAIRTSDTDSYNCRTITGGFGKSLHSYGIALDINWKTNPFIDHPGARDVRYSNGATQAEREQDVKRALADTDMTEAMIKDVLRIRTNGGLRIFEWGGHWQWVKDAMHFEIDLSPEQLEPGVDWRTVASRSAGAARAASVTSTTAGAFRSRRYMVIARSGLRLRAGAGVDFSILDTLAYGAVVYAMQFAGDWVMVDLQGDNRADGYMYKSYLTPVN